MTQQLPPESTTLPPYQYSALPEGSWIRVAALQPYRTHVEEQLHIEFELVQFNDADRRDYTAISYTWDGTREIPIVCNGQILLITSSLMSALCTLRQAEQTIFVWADAMCIDQSEAGRSERTQQVKQMDYIFQRASNVLVYLGQFTAQEKEAFAMVNTFCAIDLSKIDVMSSKSLAEAHTLVMSATKDHALPTLESQFWTHFRNIMEKPWFTRLWVIQEYAVAQRVSFLIDRQQRMEAAQFQLGTQTAFWYYRMLALPLLERLTSKGFTAAETVALWIPRYSRQLGYYLPIDQFQKLIRELSRVISNNDRFAEIIDFRQQFQAQKAMQMPASTYNITQVGLGHRHLAERCNPWWKYRKHTFFRHYVRTVSFAASENRDRVYALLGLCPEKDIWELRVDYEQPTWKVAERISQHLIARGHGVYMLTTMSRSAHRGKHGWRVLLCESEKYKSEHLCRLVMPSGRFEKNLFRAGGVEESIQVLNEQESLLASVAGIHIGELDAICRVQLPELVLQSRQSAGLDMTSLTWWQGMKMQIKWYKDGVKWLGEMEDWIRSCRHQSSLLELECWRALCCGLTFDAKAQRELIRDDPAQFDPGVAILKCKQAYKSLWSLFWGSLNQNVAIPWDHLHTSRDMQLAMDTHGRVCSVPEGSQVGDLVCIFKGFPLPFILRPVANKPHLLLGACYVQGVMDGDYFEAAYRKSPRSFIIEAGPAADDE